VLKTQICVTRPQCVNSKCPKYLLFFHLPSHVVVSNDDNDDKDVSSCSED
jgi:hypothetical protein